MSSTNQPVPGTGPDTTFNIADPTSWVMVITWAISGVALFHPGFTAPPIVIQTVASVIAGVVTSTSIFSKHHLAASVAVPVVTSEPLAPLVTPVPPQ